MVRGSAETQPRRSGGGGDVVGPLLHEAAAAVEEVGAHVGGLDAVAVDVRQGEFADVARRVGAFGSPVPEAARGQAVGHRAEIDVPQRTVHVLPVPLEGGWHDGTVADAGIGTELGGARFPPNRAGRTRPVGSLG